MIKIQLLVSFFDKFNFIKEIYNMELNGITSHVTSNVRKIPVRYCWKIKVFGLGLLSESWLPGFELDWDILVS